jgi:hypothetical protein
VCPWRAALLLVVTHPERPNAEIPPSETPASRLPALDPVPRRLLCWLFHQMRHGFRAPSAEEVARHSGDPESSFFHRVSTAAGCTRGESLSGERPEADRRPSLMSPSSSLQTTVVPLYNLIKKASRKDRDVAEGA